MALYAKIIVNLHHQKVDQIYTYSVSSELIGAIQKGMLVEVPFGKGNRTTAGYVIDLTQDADLAADRIKQVRRLVSQEPVFSEANLSLARQMQKRYHAPLSACLALFIPKIPGLSDPVVQKIDLMREPAAERLGEGQRRFLTALKAKGGKGCLLKEIRKEAPISAASLASLVKQQLVYPYDEPEGKPPAAFISPERSRRLPLNAEQLKAREEVTAALKDRRYHGFLLHGITGSGKTEIYMQCIQAALDQGRQAILLVPEISLTPQLIQVFSERFGQLVGITHSRMTDRERSIQWRLSQKGDYQVMIGPRSALFTPFPRLGLVIIDEEHETSYQSERQAPHYHAREVARMLCKQQGCPLVLGSATPSVESYFQAQQGDLTLLTLTQRAVAEARLPEIELIDMRSELEAGNMGLFCRRLQEAVRDRLTKGEQTILFLNRKGYSTFVNCRQCGFVLKCPRCYLPYTYHKDQKKLICHHCGKVVEMPERCPDCGSPYIRQFGAGTQRVQEEAQRLFPEARIMRMDMGTMKNREDYETVYRQFRNQEGDILIGTQMIAKGFDFPNVTLVGVLAADMTLYSSDYHSTERTYQLITQVAGRAGRAQKPGLVLVQTYSPEHYCIRSAKDQNYSNFYRNELAARKIMGCPPFTHLAQIVLTGPKEDAVIAGAQRLSGIMGRYSDQKGFEILGPSPASLGRINNIFRWKILIKHPDEERLRAFTEYCCNQFLAEEKRVIVLLDIDPATIV